MAFETIDLIDVVNRIANDDYHILKLKVHFEPDVIQAKVQEALCKFPLKNKDFYENYKAVGLQYQNDDNPIYDVVNSIAYITNDSSTLFRKVGSGFDKKNVIGLQFQEFFSAFSDHFDLVRGRILVSEPGNKIAEHTDGHCTGALHFAVETNPAAKLVIENIEYHIPRDGYFYLINSSRPHYIKNESALSRTHFVFPINPFCFKTLTRNQFDKMLKYFLQFNIDPEKYQHIKIVDEDKKEIGNES